MNDTPQDILPSFKRRVVLFPEAVFVVNTNAIITRVDRQTFTMFGWANEQEIIGKNFYDLIVEEDVENVKSAFQKILVE